MDETTELADLILPDHTYLESWDISTTPAGGDQAVFTLTRPAVKPEFNTRQTADVLIALSRELGEAMAKPIPFESSEAVVKQAAGSDEFWKTFTERGVWVGKTEGVAGPATRFSKLSPVYPAEVRAENPEEYPFVLLAYEHAALGFGSQANLPWLQELPDPMTSVMWGSWVEVNPKTAAALGVKDGDLVEVTTVLGAVRAPVVVYPAIRPDVIAIPYGQGHTSYGRYAGGRGASAAALEPFVVRQGVVPMTVRAKVARVEGRAKLVRFGTSLPEHIEGER
jgi:anaerobic selenocysteine-containing dehydrogenase